MQLALDGGTPVHTTGWPGPHPFNNEDEARIVAVLRASNWSDGEVCHEFEQRFAEYCGARHAILAPNGTAAIEMALHGCEIGPGDEVILPAMTWPSTAIAVLRTGADPVPVDIDIDTFAISPRKIAQALTPRSKAIIATHLFCSQADMISILDVARSANIRVIEDATQAVGARRQGRVLGTFGDVGVFSFNQKKMLTCGEGGCLITNDVSIHSAARAVCDVDPTINQTPKRLPETYRSSEFHAAVLLTQLSKLTARLQITEERGDLLRGLLETHPRLMVLNKPEGTEVQSFYNFCFRVIGHPDITWFRRALSLELGLPVSAAYAPLSNSPVVDTSLDRRYQHLGSKLKGQSPIAFRAHYEEAVRFPYNALLAKNEDIRHIDEAVKKVLGASASGTRFDSPR